jgi:hypothetical protein
MDPIKDGKSIFQTIHGHFKRNQISDMKEASKFFDMLHQKTRGLVIIDFLDAANWDNFAGHLIDEGKKILFLYWRDYRFKKETPKQKELRTLFSRADLMGLVMRFQSIDVMKTQTFPLFFLRGYAWTDNEIKDYLGSCTQEFKIIDAQDNFSKTVVRKIRDKWEVFSCLNTPIHSIVILPKDCGLRAFDSKDILLEYNLLNCLNRLYKVRKQLHSLEEIDKDSICEKANTVRRVFENVLKIECCYRHRQVNLKKPYSQLLLGDLISLLKSFHEDPNRLVLNKIRIWSNELSHDSGLPIEKSKAESVCLLTMSYTELLRSLIKEKPRPNYGIMGSHLHMSLFS